MNTDHKFRAFDPEEKKWIYLNISNPTNDYINEWGYWVRNIVIKGRTQHQFIGLEDKNKKEIYEGDIMKTVYGNYAVGFSKIDAQFQLLNSDHYRMDGELPYFWDCEIIGNIHENPELLLK